MFSIKQIILFGIFICLVFLGGWNARIWYDGNKESQELKVQQLVSEGISKIQQENAKNYEDMKIKLDERKVEIIEKDVPKFIDRPIYLNKCIDEDGAKTIDKFRTESINIRKQLQNDK